MSQANSTWLDQLLNKIIESMGTQLPQRSALNFLGGTLTDNPSNDSTDFSPTTVTPVRVASGHAVTAANDGVVLANGGATVNQPSSPIDGTRFTVTDTSASASNSNKIQIGTGSVPTEDPSTPGSFVAGAVYIIQPSATCTWIWDATLGHWKLLT